MNYIHSLQQKKQTATNQLHLPAGANIIVQKMQKINDIREWQNEQGFFKFTETIAKHLMHISCEKMENNIIQLTLILLFWWLQERTF